MRNSERTYRIYDVNIGIPEIPENFLMGYIRGNAMWPQKHFATSIFVAQQALADGRSFSELTECQFSVGQLEKIVRAMNRSHRFNEVAREFPETEEEIVERSISIEEINYLWERSIFGAANRIIAVSRIVPALSPHVSEFSNLRNLYYENKELATEQLKSLDELMATHTTEFAIVAQILNRIKYHLTDRDLKELSVKYRDVITTYKSECGGDQSEYLLIKSGIVDEATTTLIEKLEEDFPNFDWNNFDSSH